MQEKKIIALSMVGKPTLVQCVYRDGVLHILEAKSLNSAFEWLRGTFAKKLRESQDKGYTIVVEEPTMRFAKYGYKLNLADIRNERAVILTALDLYYQMSEQEAITFPPALRIKIPHHIVDVVPDDKGRTTYKIDWSQIKPTQRTLLLAIFAAVFESPISANYLTQMYSKMDYYAHMEDDEAHLQGFFSATKGVDNRYG